MARIFYKTWIYDLDFQTLGFQIWEKKRWNKLALLAKLLELVAFDLSELLGYFLTEFAGFCFASVAWLFSNLSWWLFSKKSWRLSTWWQIQSGTRRANPRMPARCDALDILLNTKRDTQMKIDRVACLRNNFSKLTFQLAPYFSFFARISKQGFDRSQNAHSQY